MLIQVGGNEVLLDDATRLATRAATDGVSVTLEVTPDVPHVFVSFAGMLDEADSALDNAGRFLSGHLEQSA
jgi:acetyl esterase/lipase